VDRDEQRLSGWLFGSGQRPRPADLRAGRGTGAQCGARPDVGTAPGRCQHRPRRPGPGSRQGVPRLLRGHR
jgi:hypothetical protein